MASFISSPVCPASGSNDAQSSISSQSLLVSPEKYKYRTLEFGDIRVLHLLDTSDHGDGEEIRCTIYHVPISSPGTFTALSYVWGSHEKRSAMHVKSATGHLLGRIPLTKNLRVALQDLQNADAIQPKTFWIDQICINQDDLHERGSQVATMSKIYKSATQVVTYLGPNQPGDAEAIALMRRIDDYFYRQYLLHLENDLRFRSAISQLQELRPNAIFNSYYHLFLPLGPCREIFSLLPLPELDENDPGWFGLAQIISETWSQRAWVLQENVLNRNTITLRGTTLLDWDLVGSMAGLRYYAPQVLLFPMVRRTKQFEWDAARSLFTLWQIWSFDLSITLELLLGLLNHVQCSDPRDRIFALLSLVLESEKLGINSDYTRSVEEVFTEVAEKVLIRSQSLELLAKAAGSLRSQLLPTWVPNWGPSASEGRGTLEDSSWEASGDTKPSITIDSGVLVLDGRVIDSIAVQHPKISKAAFGCHLRTLFHLFECLKSDATAIVLGNWGDDTERSTTHLMGTVLSANVFRIRRIFEDLRLSIVNSGMQMEAVDTALYRIFTADSKFPQEDFTAGRGFRALLKKLEWYAAEILSFSTQLARDKSILQDVADIKTYQKHAIS